MQTILSLNNWFRYSRVWSGLLWFLRFACRPTFSKLLSELRTNDESVNLKSCFLSQNEAGLHHHPSCFTPNVTSKCGCLQISWWVYVNSSSHQSIAILASGKSHCFRHYQYHSTCWGYILWLCGENIPFSCCIVSYYLSTDVIEFVSKLFTTFRLDQWPTMYIMFGWLYV